MQLFRRAAITLALIGIFAITQAPHSVPAASIMPLSLNECAYGTVCLWDGANSSTFLISHYGAPGTCYPLSASANNKGSSFYNHLADGHHVQFYDGSNCTGHLMCSTADFCGAFADGTSGNFNINSSRTGYISDNATSSFFYNNG